MIDRTQVTSGADIEILVSEDYLRHALLAQVEAGRFPSTFEVVNPAAGTDFLVTIHPPDDFQRRYLPHPDADLPQAANRAFDVELLGQDAEAFASLLLFVSLENRATGDAPIGPLPGVFLFDVALRSESSAFGLEEGHEVELTFVRLDDQTRNALLVFSDDPDIVEKVEGAIRERVDTTVPLGALGGDRVQSLRLRRFVTDDQRSLGLYIDLALRSGPEPASYLPGRMDVDAALDFRPPTSPLAMATASSLLPLLGPDLKFRQAEETSAGSGDFRFPLRRNPLDDDSDEIGRIKDIDVKPELRIVNEVLVPTGRLLIDLHCEYTDALGDPDFHLQLFVDPQIDGEGLVEYDLRVDVDLGFLAQLLAVAAGIVLMLLFAPGAGLGAILLGGALGGLVVANGLASESIISKLLEERLDRAEDASFLDTVPFRLTAARRRWDPFYVTEHQVVALTDEVAIDGNGISFAATGLKLDKQPAPRRDVVVREEVRSGSGEVTALRYRVRDVDRVVPADQVAPGTDRLPFAVDDPVEPTLLTLGVGEIVQRAATRRVLAPVNYTAERIHLVHNQIDHLLCLSRRERGELRGRLVRAFRAEAKDEIRADVGADMEDQSALDLEAQLGRPATPEELEKEVDRRLEELVDVRIPDFVADELPGLLEAEIAEVLRFDLAPEEMIDLQRAGIVALDGVEIIVRRADDGTETPYYRDRPDGDPADNLLALPHYSPPYAPVGVES